VENFGKEAHQMKHIDFDKIGIEDLIQSHFPLLQELFEG